MEFIAHDYCGWNDRYGRFTHLPGCHTLVCQPWMDQRDWDEAQLKFLEAYPGLTVHECPDAYSTDGKPMGTTDEICERLRARMLPV